MSKQLKQYLADHHISSEIQERRTIGDLSNEDMLVSLEAYIQESLVDTDISLNNDDLNADILDVVTKTSSILEDNPDVGLPTKVAILEASESIARILNTEDTSPSLESITTTDDVLTYTQEGIVDRVKGILSSIFKTSDKAIGDLEALTNTNYSNYTEIARSFSPVDFAGLRADRDVTLKTRMIYDKDSNPITDYKVLVKTLQENLTSLQKINNLLDTTSNDIVSIIESDLSKPEKIDDLIGVFANKYLPSLEKSPAFIEKDTNDLNITLITPTLLTNEHLTVTIPKKDSNLTFKDKIRQLEANRSDSLLNRLNKKTDITNTVELIIDKGSDVKVLDSIYNDYVELYNTFTKNNVFKFRRKQRFFRDALLKLSDIANIIGCYVFTVSPPGLSFTIGGTIYNALFKEDGLGDAFRNSVKTNYRVLKNYLGFMQNNLVVLDIKAKSEIINYALSFISSLTNIKNRALRTQLQIAYFINYNTIQNLNLIRRIYAGLQ